jgi:hypothetical protein
VRVPASRAQRRRVADDGGRLGSARDVRGVAPPITPTPGVRTGRPPAADIVCASRVVEEPRQRNVERDAQNGHRVTVEEEGVTAKSTLKRNRKKSAVTGRTQSPFDPFSQFLWIKL